MKKNVACMALSCACVSAFAAAPSLLPPEKSFKLVWQDEFDGNALDESKWNFRTNSPEPEVEKAWQAGDEFVVDFVRVYDIVK